MVFLEHRPRVYYSLTTAVEATERFVQQQCKGRNYCTAIGKGRNYCRSIPRDPPHGKMAAISDDCERIATVALPTAASPGFISGELGISAAEDAFSTVSELPLRRFKKGQTNKLDGVPRTQTSRLLPSYYSSRSHGTVCTTTCKGRNYCTAIGKGRNNYYCRSIPRDPPHGKKWLLFRMIVRELRQ